MTESIQTTTASKEKIPQFIPLAMGESEAPKQAAQAIAEGVESARNAPTKIVTNWNRVRIINS